MIARWRTGRCVQEDIAGLTHTREGLRGFLQQQDAASSSSEPFGGRTRADTFTFHNGPGRGAVWQDHERGVLWLCCTSDHHDPGYAHGHALVDTDRLYPDLDPGHLAGVGATIPWGECADEDRLESLRFTGQAVHALASVTRPTDGGVSFDDGVGLIRLGVSEDVWTMTIRRTLVYPDRAIDRDRWLSTIELEQVFAELTGLDPDEAEFWAPPYDAHHINIHFLGGTLAPRNGSAAASTPSCAEATITLCGPASVLRR